MRRFIEGVPYLLKTGYMQTGERVNPDFPDANFGNHLKVYQFAAQFAPGKRVLDVGSGTGYGSEYLAAYASSVTGIDYSKTAVRFAQSRYKRPTFLVMDAHTLHFPDASFDFILSSENFEHLSDQAKSLREVRRVLAPGGMALIGTPNPEVMDGPNLFHTKENTYEELHELLGATFSEFEILENSLPHDLNRPHGIDPSAEPLVVFGRVVDKTHLSNTHSFLCFCR